MTLKEELEILRGVPIRFFEGDPMDIPCIETSDAEKLCKHPVVSVHMITYNHEPYIRQAIEGVMMQKTDFEFELVIGEDCSQDKTREICFEYQKKHPDKIRVLWWHENVSNLGGNGRRVSAHCRGEFIAFCEGDDYWIDPLKLQKQVDVMRNHPNVGLCFTDGRFHNLDGTISSFAWHRDILKMPEGMIPGTKYWRTMILGTSPYTCNREWTGPLTASIMYRRSHGVYARQKYEINRWRLMLGDLQLCVGVSSVSDVYCLPDICTHYRCTTTGVVATRRQRVHCDGCLVRLYFFENLAKLPIKEYPPAACDDVIMNFMLSFWDRENFPIRSKYFGRLKYIWKCIQNKEIRSLWFRPITLFVIGFCLLNWFGRIPQGILNRVRLYCTKIGLSRPSENVLRLYAVAT